ncbi:MAG: hypothetical protein ABR497_11755, partial [Kiritimatiellia bacterium]
MQAKPKIRPELISKRGYILNQPTSGLPWVLRVAQEHWCNDCRLNRRGHDSSFIACILEGRINIDDETEHLSAGPGNIIYLAQEPRTWELRVDAAQGLRLIIVVIRDQAANMVVGESLGRKTRLFNPGDCANIESLFHCMLTAASRGYPAASDIVAGLLVPLLQSIRQEHD